MPDETHVYHLKATAANAVERLADYTSRIELQLSALMVENGKLKDRLQAQADFVGEQLISNREMMWGELESLQAEMQKWRAHNFPNTNADEHFFGMVEEIGELAHADLKQKQNIRGSSAKHEAAIIDSLGDLFVYAMGYASLRGYSLASCIQMAWDEVKERDWIKWPDTGMPQVELKVEMSEVTQEVTRRVSTARNCPYYCIAREWLMFIDEQIQRMDPMPVWVNRRCGGHLGHAGPHHT